MADLPPARTPDEAITRAMPAPGEFIPFEGQNCEYFGECEGWDGDSHRCQCGNRRVTWEIEGTSEQGYVAYPSAY